MRIDHWYAHPTNRRLVNRVGGTGTVIAAISAGLIAGLSAHPTENAVLASHRVSDAALDSTTPEHQQASTPATAASAQQVNAVQPAQVPSPALTSSPASVAIGGTGTAAHGASAAAPTSVPATPPEQSGSRFQPYTRNGTTGTATQTTSGPSGTATITTTPTTNTTGRSDQRTAQHTSTSTTPAGKSIKDKHHDSSSGDDHNNSADHSTDHGADSDRTQPDTHGDGIQHSGSTAYSPLAPAGSVAQQGGGSTDSGSASRVAQALPPGFTPSQPRESTPAATSSSPAVSSPARSLPPVSVPTGSSTPGSTTAATTAPTNALPTSGVSGGTQSGTQYQPAQSGPAQSDTTSGSGAESSPGTAPVTALTPVACPAAVANATCYQQLSAPGSTSSVPTINPAAPAALPNTAAPATLPNAGSARVPAASSVPSRSVPSGDCQASGNNTDSTVPALGWDDFSAWIWGRVQDCINQGMARGGSGWNTGTGSSTTSAKASGGKSRGEKSSAAKSAGSTKKSSPDSDSSSGSKKQGPED